MTNMIYAAVVAISVIVFAKMAQKRPEQLKYVVVVKVTATFMVGGIFLLLFLLLFFGKKH